MDSACPGCGLVLPHVEWPEPDGLAASRACFRRFGELTSVTQALQDPKFPHQYAVDAYAAQHARADSPPIRTAFALVGPYLACERGFTGREVQLEHMRLARTRRDWPRFFRRISAAMTVADASVSTLLDWCAAVWRQWEPDQQRVRDLFK